MCQGQAPAGSRDPDPENFFQNRDRDQNRDLPFSSHLVKHAHVSEGTIFVSFKTWLYTGLPVGVICFSRPPINFLSVKPDSKTRE